MVTGCDDVNLLEWCGVERLLQPPSVVCVVSRRHHMECLGSNQACEALPAHACALIHRGLATCLTSPHDTHGRALDDSSDRRRIVRSSLSSSSVLLPLLPPRVLWNPSHFQRVIKTLQRHRDIRHDTDNGLSGKNVSF